MGNNDAVVHPRQPKNHKVNVKTKDRTLTEKDFVADYPVGSTDYMHEIDPDLAAELDDLVDRSFRRR